MLAEFVKSIADLAKADTRFEKFKTNDGAEIVRLPDGTVRTFDRVPERRRFSTDNVEAFCSLLTDDTDPETANAAPLVIVSEFSARGYFDPVFRDEWVDLFLAESEALRALRSIERPTDQKAAVALLRDKLFGCCDAGLLAAMRALDFTRRGDGTRSIEHGRESLGRAVEAKVQSRAGELGEFYEFEFPVYAQQPLDAFRTRHVFALELDATAERVRLVPRGDAMLHAKQSAARYLRDTIADLIDENAVVVIAGEGDHASA
jgi:hypothetical protein